MNIQVCDTHTQPINQLNFRGRLLEDRYVKVYIYTDVTNYEFLTKSPDIVM